MKKSVSNFAQRLIINHFTVVKTAYLHNTLVREYTFLPDLTKKNQNHSIHENHYKIKNIKNTIVLFITILYCNLLLAQPLFTVLDPICGGTPTISVPSNTFGTYSWNMGNGITGTNFLPPTTTYGTVGSSYTISRTVTSNTPFGIINAITVNHTNGFQNCLGENNKPDYYLQIKKYLKLFLTE